MRTESFGDASYTSHTMFWFIVEFCAACKWGVQNLEDWPGKGEEPGAAQRFDHIGMENQHEASEGALSRV